MRKSLLVVLMVLFALAAVGCGGRNTAFGVVDMQRIESESQVFKDVKEDVMKKAATAQEEVMKEMEGKPQDEAQKIMENKSAEMQMIQSEAQNKLKASFEAATNKVAADKKLGAILVKDAVPQGGIDVTDDVLKNMQ
ncbi:MAG TPA: OmpH family outer membrane protein [Candidatus Avacidaminococcus intestinavium]|uniref:OmpH family outer membrane protein n=1 Tax=Candidatus Avacidaminococcus intestinavium TaxID=2840684 RepID=A0A9D1MNZ4_9FIRM|nr:OmpH family outer membrane protein [Candidatus Avacidaminococcus intestinavium]